MDRKEKIVSTRITKDEYNFLIDKSQKIHLSIAEYLRLLIQIKKNADEKNSVFN
jgi:hypothetical protein